MEVVPSSRETRDDDGNVVEVKLQARLLVETGPASQSATPFESVCGCDSALLHLPVETFDSQSCSMMRVSHQVPARVFPQAVGPDRGRRASLVSALS